nr:hypothetical protein [Arabidopsis thaliana]
MSQLLSSPPMAVFSKTFINHKFSDARFLSSHSILTSGGFAGKIIPLKPTARLKLTVKSRQSDYFEKQRFGDSSSSQNAEVSSPRFYVGHSIYKGKAALTIEPRAPEFVALEIVMMKINWFGERYYDCGVQNKLLNVDESVYIPITKAEFAVLISAFNAGVHLLTPSNQKTLTALTMLRLSMEETTNGVDDGD